MATEDAAEEEGGQYLRTHSLTPQTELSHAVLQDPTCRLLMAEDSHTYEGGTSTEREREIKILQSVLSTRRFCPHHICYNLLLRSTIFSLIGSNHDKRCKNDDILPLVLHNNNNNIFL